jgi:F-type H+-transporting ATPase subunit delta
MRGSKQVHQFARILFRLSLEDGRLSPERVSAVLHYLQEKPPRHPLQVLKAYYRLASREIARSRALVEAVDPPPAAALEAIADAFSRKYNRPITPASRRNPHLIAGLRVRVGDDVYDATIAGQLEALASGIT